MHYASSFPKSSCVFLQSGESQIYSCLCLWLAYVVLLSDFISATFLYHLSLPRTRLTGLDWQGREQRLGGAHQARKAICMLSRKYSAFLCKQVNRTCKWFPVQLEACFSWWTFYRDAQCLPFHHRVIFPIRNIASTAPYLKQKGVSCHESIYTSGHGFKRWRKPDLSNQSDHIMCNAPNSELSDIFKLHHQHRLTVLSPGLSSSERYKLLKLTRQKEDNLWHLFISPYEVKIKYLLNYNADRSLYLRMFPLCTCQDSYCMQV